ncbi:hypothetical protein SAMN06297164_2160 [Nitrosomonas ureae]|uniref:Uncharacterized protein n=1 Tax=Nitrosomonas ureae TaxID=44577 RepID=A0A286ABG7_9PROT|nr:hypothetical protein SAMN06297164_2160 [Nitrosomonas ureae]
MMSIENRVSMKEPIHIKDSCTTLPGSAITN